ncbi:DUF6228 family protein [Streptomyces sp. NPDC004227]
MPNGLACDFRGWEGERVLANNHLVVTASFRSGGHVHHVRHHAAWQPPGWAGRSPARPHIRPRPQRRSAPPAAGVHAHPSLTTAAERA